MYLPTEAEWLTAAHAADHAYPWGDEFDATKANTKEGGLEQNSPVHMYPSGATPEDIYDLSGNVWEWSADWDEDKYPWLKGGWDGKDQAKSSARGWGAPHDTYGYGGFRCVVVPISRV